MKTSPIATSATLPTQMRNQFLDQGYLVLPGLLDARTDLAPVEAAISAMTDDLLAYSGAGQPQDDLDFAHRFARLVGFSQGSCFDHIDPTLNVYCKGFRYWSGAPCAQLPEYFSLFAHPAILDAITEIIGSEIYLAPAHHLVVKLGHGHLEDAQEAGQEPDINRVRRPAGLGPGPFMNAFQMHATPWHMDEFPGLGDPDGHRYIGAWIPLTAAGAGAAGLRVIPGSHRNGYGPLSTDLQKEAITLETQPGDVVLIDGKLFHASDEALDRMACRIALSARYQPVGMRSGRSFMPGFVVRSETEPGTVLTDAQAWSEAWDAALRHFDQCLFPARHHFQMDSADIDAMDRQWSERVTEPGEWMRLRASSMGTWRTRAWRALHRIYGLGRAATGQG